MHDGMVTLVLEEKVEGKNCFDRLGLNILIIFDGYSGCTKYLIWKFFIRIIVNGEVHKTRRHRFRKQTEQALAVLFLSELLRFTFIIQEYDNSGEECTFLNWNSWFENFKLWQYTFFISSKFDAPLN